MQWRIAQRVWGIYQLLAATLEQYTQRGLCILGGFACSKDNCKEKALVVYLMIANTVLTDMQQRHLLCACAYCGYGTVLYKQLQKASIMQYSMMYGIIFVHNKINLLGTCDHQLLHAVPGATLAGQVQQWLLCPKGYPRLLHLLRHHAQHVILIAWGEETYD